MSEVLFYHLTEHSLQQALPGLLEKCLERDWRVVVQTANADQRDGLNDFLWTYRDDSFLPHSASGATAENADMQPIWLTEGTDNPNDANVRFIVGDTVPPDLGGYDRVIYMFDGRDEDLVASARERWKIDKAAGHDLTYWQQDEMGRWVKKA